MAENTPTPDLFDVHLREEFEQLKQITVQQLMSHNQTFEEIMKVQKLWDMKLNAFELRLNAAIEEMRLNVEKLPYQAAKVLTDIQQKVIHNAKASLSKKEKEQPSSDKAE
jgi:hypothetical protein